jgi:monoamine oxidase
MSVRRTQVAIVGAGLAGLYAAWLLDRQGIPDYVLLEARAVPGGRIATFDPAGGRDPGAAGRRDRFDLGPAWFWPDYQQEMRDLIDRLGLERFAQHETGDMMFERSSQAAPERTLGYVNAPASMRLSGGMGALIDALYRTLGPERLVTGQAVRRMRVNAGHVELESEDGEGRVSGWRAAHVLLALPPRLAVDTIGFEPALPQALAAQWGATPTWMAPHAKYIAVYDAPFWRENGLSGEAQSMRGPLGEIHDASIPGGRAALFGFLGVPVQVRRDVGDAALRAHCRAQLARLFGPQAATPCADVIKDWAQDPYTSTVADMEASGHHAAAPSAAAASGPWQARLTGIASEWSPQFPGYVAGAIEAAGIGVRAMLAGPLAMHASLHASGTKGDPQ